MRTISVEQLRVMGACSGARNWVKETFGTGEIPVTREALAAVPDQDWIEWLAEQYNHQAKATAWDAYEQAVATAWDAYEQALIDIILSA